MSSRTLLGAMLASMLVLGSAHAEERFAPYVAQKHARAVVAVVGDNDGTELTDFVIPFAVLQRSGDVDTFAVSTRPGPMRMRPAALRLKPDMDVHAFDARFPEGADYVIVPAVVHNNDAALLEWIDANGYQIVGPYREIYIKHEKNNLSDTITEVQFPDEKA